MYSIAYCDLRKQERVSEVPEESLVPVVQVVCPRDPNAPSYELLDEYKPIAVVPLVEQSHAPSLAPAAAVVQAIHYPVVPKYRGAGASLEVAAQSSQQSHATSSSSAAVDPVAQRLRVTSSSSTLAFAVAAAVVQTTSTAKLLRKERIESLLDGLEVQRKRIWKGNWACRLEPITKDINGFFAFHPAVMPLTVAVLGPSQIKAELQIAKLRQQCFAQIERLRSTPNGAVDLGRSSTSSEYAKLPSTIGEAQVQNDYFSGK